MPTGDITADGMDTAIKGSSADLNFANGISDAINPDVTQSVANIFGCFIGV